MIYTLAIGLALALLLGIIAQKFKLSPIVGYLLAGILAAQSWWGTGVDEEVVDEFSHIGVVLLLFGVGLQFHFKDLLAVQKVAVPGSVVCMVVRALTGALGYYVLVPDATWMVSILFGACMCVSSTVVLTRVLADNKVLQTPAGHTALGWLVVEDIFTIILLVLLPVFFAGQALGPALGWMTLKLTLLVLCVAYLGRYIIEKTLTYVSRSTSDELFTLAVLVIALGIAVLSSQVFNASLEFGAFLSGMVVGQSKFSARAAGDALPMRDAFAVLFFVSVGMGFDLVGLLEYWELALCALLLTLIVKPVAAYIVIRLLKRPSRMALIVSTSLSQVGEFSFILASLIANQYKILPDFAVNVITGVAIISITLIAALYRFVPRLVRAFEDRGIGVMNASSELPAPTEDRHRVIIVGYGPCGEILQHIFQKYDMEVVVIEMNIDTVNRLSKGKDKILALHGDARQRTILKLAGAEKAEAIIITAASAPAKEIASAARGINSNISIMAYTTYMSNAKAMMSSGAETVFSGEEEVALSMMELLLTRLGATDEQLKRERANAREIFNKSSARHART